MMCIAFGLWPCSWCQDVDDGACSNMDELAEALLLAVLREDGKSLVEMRLAVRAHIAVYERLVRSAALPHLGDRDVQEFRVRFRERVGRELQAGHNTAALHQALQILEEDRSSGLWPTE